MVLQQNIAVHAYIVLLSRSTVWLEEISIPVLNAFILGLSSSQEIEDG